MGFFAWIREGVRRAVLLGFSDAITTLGARTEQEDIGGNLAAALRQGLALETDPRGLPAAASGGVGRKRLGKSLSELREET